MINLRHRLVESEHQESNGFAGNFMLIKISHSACVNRQDFRFVVRNFFLLNYGSTPYSTTGFSPADDKSPLVDDTGREYLPTDLLV